MASTSLDSAPITPPGQYPPLAVVTPTDHAAWIIIAASLGTTLSVFFAGVRVFIRSSSRSEYGHDDWLLAVATALSIVQAGLILAACGAGLGKSASLLTTHAIDVIEKYVYTSNLVYIVGLVPSKAAVACFILRLTPIDTHTLFLRSSLAGLTVWGVAFLFTIAFTCTAFHPWPVSGEHCEDFFVRWTVFGSVGCIYEVAVIAMSFWLVWSLKTSISNKLTVIVTFGFRSLLLVVVGLRLKSYHQSSKSTDPTLLEAPFIAWTCTELNYSIISATFPIIRPFINNLVTNYGGQGKVVHGYGYSSWSSSGSRGSKEKNSHIEQAQRNPSNDSGANELESLTREVFIAGGIDDDRSALGTNQDGMSMASASSSRRVMIRKGVFLEVDNA